MLTCEYTAPAKSSSSSNHYSATSGHQRQLTARLCPAGTSDNRQLLPTGTGCPRGEPAQAAAPLAACKPSGWGREMGKIAIDGYAGLKNVSIALYSPYCPRWAATAR
jgi:hypothetical protein